MQAQEKEVVSEDGPCCPWCHTLQNVPATADDADTVQMTCQQEHCQRGFWMHIRTRLSYVTEKINADQDPERVDPT